MQEVVLLDKTLIRNGNNYKFLKIGEEEILSLQYTVRVYEMVKLILGSTASAKRWTHIIANRHDEEGPCDTRFSWMSGSFMSVSEITKELSKNQSKFNGHEVKRFNKFCDSNLGDEIHRVLVYEHNSVVVDKIKESLHSLKRLRSYIGNTPQETLVSKYQKVNDALENLSKAFTEDEKEEKEKQKDVPENEKEQK
jgi:hypothetical protein